MQLPSKPAAPAVASFQGRGVRSVASEAPSPNVPAAGSPIPLSASVFASVTAPFAKMMRP